MLLYLTHNGNNKVMKSVNIPRPALAKYNNGRLMQVPVRMVTSQDIATGLQLKMSAKIQATL